MTSPFKILFFILMFCIPIIGPSLACASRQILMGDIVEFRLDLFAPYDLGDLHNLRKEIKKPLIFTLRKKEQGGNYRGSEKERLEEILRLATLAPTYFDLEYDVPRPFILEISRRFSRIKMIISYHHFTQTPLDLEILFRKLQDIPAHFYKIASYAEKTVDALRMLSHVKKHAPLLGMCMGSKGEVTRILGPMVNAPWVYASNSPIQQTAPGQLGVQELSSLYKGNHTYGLIGGKAVAGSISHITHNRVMQSLHLNALYVKMEVEKEELHDFLLLAKEIGFRGLSVTMPLKEVIIPFLDHLDEKAKAIGAVNTILFQNDRLIGSNTDGKGALNAIENKINVSNKNIVILGAGGAARAIAYEAILRGAHVTLLNRSRERTLHLSKELNIQIGSITDSVDYDILINTTPHSMPISKDALRPHTYLMDIQTFPKMTQLLREGEKKRCSLIFGYEMFIQQAIGQFHIWFGNQLETQQLQKRLEEEVIKVLNRKGGFQLADIQRWL